MTTVTEPGARPPRSPVPASVTWQDLAERELRNIEDVTLSTAPAATVVIARGLSAVTYAVLALCDTCQDQAADLGNVLSDLADSTADAAGAAARIAETAATPPQRRLTALLARMRRAAEPW